MFCPNCGLEIDDITTVCPACNTKLQNLNSVINQTYNSKQQDDSSSQYVQSNTQHENQQIHNSNDQQYTNHQSQVYTNPPIEQKSVPNYLVWSILCTIFCCLPCGIVGMIYSNKVNALLIQGNFDEACYASKTAKTWNLIGTIIGVLSVIGYIIVFAMGILGSFLNFHF